MQNYLSYVEYEIEDIKMAKGSFIVQVLSRLLQIDPRTRTISILVVLSFLFATIATFSDYWLYDMASWPVRVPAPAAITSDSRLIKNVSEEIVSKQFRSNSGLWRICCYEVKCRGQCRSLSEVMGNKGSSTSAYIIGMLRDSNAFSIISMLLVLFGGILFFAGRFVIEPKTATSLTAGVLFVLSGLLNVLGLIIYISNNNKLSKAGDLPAYGWSFYLAGFSFIFCEIAGVMVVQSNVEADDGEDDDNENRLESGSKSCNNCEPERSSPTNIVSQPHVQNRGMRPPRICHQNSSIFRSVDLDSPYADEDAETDSNASQKIKRDKYGPDISQMQRSYNSNLLEPATMKSNLGNSTGRAGFYGLDRIEEQIPSTSYVNEILESTSGSSSTKQTVMADVEMPSMLPSRSRSEYKLQPMPRMYKSEHMPMQTSKSEHESISSISRHFSLERSNHKRPCFRRNSEEVDLTSFPFTSTESIHIPVTPMDFVLPAPPTFSGADEINMASAAPAQSVSVVDQTIGNDNSSSMQTKLKPSRYPRLQRMNTFEGSTNFNGRDKYLKQQTSISSNDNVEEEELNKKRRVSSISLRSRILRSLAPSGYSTSTESQAGPVNYQTHSTSIPSNIPENRLHGRDLSEEPDQLLYNRQNYLPFTSPPRSTYSPESNIPLPERRFKSRSEDFRTWNDPKNRQEIAEQKGQLNTRKFLKVDRDLLDIPQHGYSCYTLPHSGEIFNTNNCHLPNYHTLNGNLNRMHDFEISTLQRNFQYDPRIPRSYSANALSKPINKRGQKFKKAGSVIHLAKKILNSNSKSQNASRRRDGKKFSPTNDQSTTQKIKSMLSPMNPKDSEDRLTPASSGTYGELSGPITGSTAV